MNFVDPKNDLVFKKIFGDINHKYNGTVKSRKYSPGRFDAINAVRTTKRKALQKEMEKGKKEGKLKTAVIMIRELGLSVEDVFIKLCLDTEELK